MKRFIFIIALLFLFAVSSFAQTPTATPPVEDIDETIKISTNLIQLDVVVTDKDGNIVTDLKPEDFEVFENGERQDITYFSFININPQTNKLEATSAQKNSKGQVMIPVPSAKLKVEDVRRTYALVVDDLGLSFASTYWVQQALKKFINEQMQEGDLVAIIRTGSGVGALQSFTSDKRLLLAAAEKVKWNMSTRTGIGAYNALQPNFKDQLNGEIADGSKNSVEGAESDDEFAKQMEEFRNQNFSVGTLGALNYVIKGMSELPGRKSMLLFTEGFRLTVDGQPTRTFDALRVLADLANRSSVVIYTIDPRGLDVPGMLQAQDNTWLLDSNKVAQMLEERNNVFLESQQSLRYLAYETGGFPFINQNDLNKGIRKAVNDQNSYYLLGYQPDSDTFDPKKRKFNKLTVKVKRPGLNVRYRSGFFGITDEKMRDVAKTQTPAQKMISALTSPFNASGVNLSLYPIYGNDAQSGDFIRALVYIDPKDLKFEQIAGGKRKAVFDLIAMTFGDNGVAVDKLSKTYTVEVSERVYQNILKKGFVYDLTVPIKKAGAYQFRIALRDAASDAVGSASQFIEVPNFKKKKLTLSNLILDSYSATDWQKISLGQPVASGEKSVFMETTLRQFTRGNVLQYNYVIYNARPDKAQKPQLETQMRLIRDGKVVFEGGKTPLNVAGQTDLQRIQTSGALTLGKNLEPGTYILQIIVFDVVAGEKPRVSTQFVEFEITN